MKKQLVVIFLIICLVFSSVGCSPTKSTDTSAKTEPIETVTQQSPAPTPTGDIDVDKGIFNVTLTIPAEIVGSDITQQKCDDVASEEGYKSATLNADGSVTYVMSKAQHKSIMDEVREDIKQELSDMVTSGDYPNFISIKPSDDFMKFTVIIKSEELNLVDSLSVLQLYVYGGMYNAFNGTPAENITVSFVNETSGKVIHEANSKNMNKEPKP